MTRVSAYYTPEYAKRFIQAIMHEMDHNQLHEELQGRPNLPRHFGGGPACYCKEVHQHGIKFFCGACHEDPVQKGACGETQTTKKGVKRGKSTKRVLFMKGPKERCRMST